MEEKPKYNVQRHRTALIRSSIRAAATVYLLYLGYSLIRDRADSSMPGWASVAAGAAFLLIAAAIGVYAWRQYKVDLKDAEVRPEDLAAERAEQDEEPDEEQEGEPDEDQENNIM